jgi:hypothetical protein
LAVSAASAEVTKAGAQRAVMIAARAARRDSVFVIAESPPEGDLVFTRLVEF